jgi:hypothetical protein
MSASAPSSQRERENEYSQEPVEIRNDSKLDFRPVSPKGNVAGLLRRNSLQCRCRLLGDQAIPYLVRVPS